MDGQNLAEKSSEWPKFAYNIGITLEFDAIDLTDFSHKVKGLWIVEST